MVGESLRPGVHHLNGFGRVADRGWVFARGTRPYGTQGEVPDPGPPSPRARVRPARPHWLVVASGVFLLLLACLGVQCVRVGTSP